MPPGVEEMTREELIGVVSSLYHEVQNLKKLIFGAKSERFVPVTADPAQGTLDFGEVEEKKNQEADKETITYERKKPSSKNKPSRQAIPAHLRRIEHIIEPEESVMGLVKIGEEVTEELEYTPGKLYVNRYVRSKYVKREAETSKVLIGKLPERPLPKCIAGPHLLTAMIVAKFIDHLPLYRQSQMFKRQGIDLSDATICGWINAVGRLLKALYEAHRKRMLLSIYLMADETPIRVLDPPRFDKGKGCRKGYHWAYYDPVNKWVLFDYRSGRGSEGPKQILKSFKGYLQTDGYAVYDEFGSKPGITLMHCWAHARRKFVEAQDNDRSRADHVLVEIQKLYALEREIKQTNPSQTQIVSMRKAIALPVIEGLKQWMMDNKGAVTPKSPIGKAIDYTLSRIEALKVYTTDARLQIDNNFVENSIRPIAVGRKNYLFAGSDEAAENAAIFYSFFATCKAKGINPETWLIETLKKIATHPISRIEELLPGAELELPALTDEHENKTIHHQIF
jgi:transposase